MAHTILLVQPGSKPESRTYTDYESVNECMEVPVFYFCDASPGVRFYVEDLGFTKIDN
jgi:hypothetical protein